jgi:glycerol-3-phosphate dehydrogenase
MRRDFAALHGAFDLLVCGGGIYGAWTAYDAALRGLKVALVEQGDWAGATSCSSSKLVHGGLRYLETYDFRLVKKALKERARLLHNAPHRVWPLRFGVPVYDDSRNGALKLKAGLMLYDMLAGFPGREMEHRGFGRAGFLEHFPFLAEQGLRGGFTYGDAQTDDARLVLELVAGAQAAGAVCVNYARLETWDEEAGKVCGATLRDMESGRRLKLHATQCVDVAGAWIAQTAEGSRWCRLSSGVHLVLPALPGDEAILLTAPSDGRVFFIIPWYGRTLLGTTDIDYAGDPARVAVEASDVDYLLAAANRYLGTAWTRADVIGSYAGLRVMKRSDAAHPSSASRDWELKLGGNGLLHSVGGKLTSAREDAATIVDWVYRRLGRTAACATAQRALPWKPQQDFSAWWKALAARAKLAGVDEESACWLLRRHGARSEEVLRLAEAEPQYAARLLSELPFIGADLLFCARDEMVLHLPDLLRRRLPLLILARLDEIELRRLAVLVASELGWDAERIEREVAACKG